ncbi:MAG TPA: hypothetical protein VFD39_01545, partial [Trueperaceae bacterium]|nr:hypothetical protein [Trueperaceae bacterium]
VDEMLDVVPRVGNVDRTQGQLNPRVPKTRSPSELHALADAGLLHDAKVGRERLFVNYDFLEVLTRAD